jgi:hypothetical protein
MIAAAAALFAMPAAAYAEETAPAPDSGSETQAAPEPAGGPSCLLHSAKVRNLSLRGVRVGGPARITDSSGAPVSAAAVTYCVRGGGQFGFALSSDSQVVLVGSTSVKDSIGPINPTSPSDAARSEFPRMRRVARSAGGTTVYRTDPRSQIVFGVKNQRVAFVGVADRLLLEYPGKLGYWLGRLGL